MKASAKPMKKSQEERRNQSLKVLSIQEHLNEEECERTKKENKSKHRPFSLQRE
jgi:hypothetical protein